MTYTPPPWRLSGCGMRILKDEYVGRFPSSHVIGTTAEVMLIGDEPPEVQKTMRANGRLMAAAPDLFEHLKTVLECWELGLKPHESQDYMKTKLLIERLEYPE